MQYVRILICMKLYNHKARNTLYMYIYIYLPGKYHCALYKFVWPFIVHTLNHRARQFHSHLSVCYNVYWTQACCQYMVNHSLQYFKQKSDILFDYNHYKLIHINNLTALIHVLEGKNIPHCTFKKKNNQFVLLHITSK